MNTASVSTAAPEDPVMEFWARVKGDPTVVKVWRTRIEWSLAERQPVIEVVPMTSITAVTTEPGRYRSTVTVTTTARAIEFRVDKEVAAQVQMLIRLLMTVYGYESEWHGRKVVGEEAVADELIDLRSLLDDGGVDFDEYEEQRARLLGF